MARSAPPVSWASRKGMDGCASVLCLEAAERALCARRRPSRPTTRALLPRTTSSGPSQQRPSACFARQAAANSPA